MSSTGVVKPGKIEYLLNRQINKFFQHGKKNCFFQFEQLNSLSSIINSVNNSYHRS